MVKGKSDPETDRLTIDLINDKILRHTIQFFQKTKEGLRPFGSGVLALLHEVHFILTCSHVADHLTKDNNDLFIRVDSKGYINVLGEIKYTDIDKSKGIDLAYIKIDQQMLPYLLKPYIFLTIDKFAKHNLRLDGMNYCVLGYPAKNIKYVNGRMETGASYYLASATNEKPYDYYKLSKDNFFLVQMQGKATDVISGEKVKVDSEFYGISGGGLWYIKYIVNPITNITSVDYRLIGILMEFRKGKYFCLIANKIHLILEGLTKIEGLNFRLKK